ncbi:MAG TPA: CocE/NonD family hydrolase [Gammaproteobacteria bacterium]|nr:CocE/NonD family hydrolase [Gammaproteobacteria bacterium]
MSTTRIVNLVLAFLGATGTAAAAELGPPSGTGAWPAVAESRAELPNHTIYHPQHWPETPLPLLVWGNGACRDNGLAYGAFLRQIASHGYLVVSVGRPREERPFDPNPPPAPPAAAAPPANTPDETQPEQLLEAIDWATRENAREGGELHGRIDVTHIAVGGHSCGGLQALAVSDDPRIRTTLVLASGIYVRPGTGRSGVRIDKSQLGRLHGPMLYLSGGPTDIAYPNATDDVARLEHVPVFFGALPVGHGGTFWTEKDGGEWARVSARWLDWQLKADADASWDFAGPSCRLCTNERWTVVQKHLPAPTGPYRQSLYVPVRDGTRLAMNVYRAAHEGVPVAAKRPVLFAFTPYRARYRDAKGRVIEGDQFARADYHALLEHGYVVAVADIRGKGASFGARRGFQDRTEAGDGRDLVQWLATQPWSNGEVGMFGCSYLGGTTIHVASTAPPALKAIFTGATDLDKFAFVRNGGITAQFNTRPDEPLTDDLMSLPVDEDRDGSLLRAAVAQHAANTPMAALWYGMPFRDSTSTLTGNRFWEEVGPYTYLDALKRSGIATYFWGNWQDEPTSQVILWHENLGGRLLLGPGTHCVPPPGFDFAGEVRRFFDETVKHEAPAQPAPRVTWWLDGAKDAAQWQHGEQWPGAHSNARTWFLAQNSAGQGDLTLQTVASRTAKPSFKVDYSVASSEYFAFWVGSQHGHGLSFTSSPLQAEQDLVGYPVMHLRVGSDRPEPLLFAYLEQLAPDGKAEVIAFGRLAAAYRKTGAAPYATLGLPWHTGLAADYAPLKAGQDVELSFALTPAARVIPAGQRLRVVITGADPRQRNLEQIRVDPPPTISVLLGGRSGSRIDLPLRAHSDSAAVARVQGDR